mgnify:FL=1
MLSIYQERVAPPPSLFTLHPSGAAVVVPQRSSPECECTSSLPSPDAARLVLQHRSDQEAIANLRHTVKMLQRQIDVAELTARAAALPVRSSSVVPSPLPVAIVPPPFAGVHLDLLGRPPPAAPPRLLRKRCHSVSGSATLELSATENDFSAAQTASLERRNAELQASVSKVVDVNEALVRLGESREHDLSETLTEVQRVASDLADRNADLVSRVAADILANRKVDVLQQMLKRFKSQRATRLACRLRLEAMERQALSRHDDSRFLARCDGLFFPAANITVVVTDALICPHSVPGGAAAHESKLQNRALTKSHQSFASAQTLGGALTATAPLLPPQGASGGNANHPPSTVQSVRQVLPIALEAYQQLVCRIGREHGGYLSSLLFTSSVHVFADSLRAMQFVRAVQRALLQEPWPEQVITESCMSPVTDNDGRVVLRGPRVRHGMCFGSAAETVVNQATSRPEFVGRDVLAAASLCSVARPGEALVHENVMHALRALLQNGDAESSELASVCIPSGHLASSATVAAIASDGSSGAWSFGPVIYAGVATGSPQAYSSFRTVNSFLAGSSTAASVAGSPSMTPHLPPAASGRPTNGPAAGPGAAQNANQATASTTAAAPPQALFWQRRGWHSASNMNREFSVFSARRANPSTLCRFGPGHLAGSALDFLRVFRQRVLEDIEPSSVAGAVGRKPSLRKLAAQAPPSSTSHAEGGKAAAAGRRASSSSNSPPDSAANSTTVALLRTRLRQTYAHSRQAQRALEHLERLAMAAHDASTRSIPVPPTIRTTNSSSDPTSAIGATAAPAVYLVVVLGHALTALRSAVVPFGSAAGSAAARAVTVFGHEVLQAAVKADAYLIKQEGEALVFAFCEATLAVRFASSVHHHLILVPTWPTESELLEPLLVATSSTVAAAATMLPSRTTPPNGETLLSLPPGSPFTDTFKTVDDATSGRRIFHGVRAAIAVHMVTAAGGESMVDPVTGRIDYVGPAAQYAYDLCCLARGGETLVSDAVTKTLRKPAVTRPPGPAHASPLVTGATAAQPSPSEFAVLQSTHAVVSRTVHVDECVDDEVVTLLPSDLAPRLKHWSVAANTPLGAIDALKTAAHLATRKLYHLRGGADPALLGTADCDSAFPTRLTTHSCRSLRLVPSLLVSRRRLRGRTSAMESHLMMQHDDSGLIGEVPHTSPSTAIVFLGVQGSAALFKVAADAFPRAQARFNRVVRELCRQHEGYPVKFNGFDDWFVSFADVPVAVDFCMALQQAMMLGGSGGGSSAWGGESAASAEMFRNDAALRVVDPKSCKTVMSGLRVRIGVAHGHVSVTTDPNTRRADYCGHGVQAAFRCGRIAAGGDVLLTAEAFTQLRENDAWMGFRRLGALSVERRPDPFLKYPAAGPQLYSVLPRPLAGRRCVFRVAQANGGQVTRMDDPSVFATQLIVKGPYWWKGATPPLVSASPTAKPFGSNSSSTVQPLPSSGGAATSASPATTALLPPGKTTPVAAATLPPSKPRGSVAPSSRRRASSTAAPLLVSQNLAGSVAPATNSGVADVSGTLTAPGLAGEAGAVVQDTWRDLHRRFEVAAGYLFSDVTLETDVFAVAHVLGRLGEIATRLAALMYGGTAQDSSRFTASAVAASASYSGLRASSSVIFNPSVSSVASMRPAPLWSIQMELTTVPGVQELDPSPPSVTRRREDRDRLYRTACAQCGLPFGPHAFCSATGHRHIRSSSFSAARLGTACPSMQGGAAGDADASASVAVTETRYDAAERLASVAGVPLDVACDLMRFVDEFVAVASNGGTLPTASFSSQPITEVSASSACRHLVLSFDQLVAFAASTGDVIDDEALVALTTLTGTTEVTMLALAWFLLGRVGWWQSQAVLQHALDEYVALLLRDVA